MVVNSEPPEPENFPMHVLKLVVNNGDPVNATIELDGQPLRGVNAISIDVGCNRPPLVTLRVWADVDATVEDRLRESPTFHVERIEPESLRHIETALFTWEEPRDV